MPYTNRILRNHTKSRFASINHRISSLRLLSQPRSINLLSKCLFHLDILISRYFLFDLICESFYPNIICLVNFVWVQFHNLLQCSSALSGFNNVVSVTCSHCTDSRALPGSKLSLNYIVEPASILRRSFEGLISYIPQTSEISYISLHNLEQSHAFTVSKL